MLDPGSLEVRINYTAANAANIVVQWDYTTGESAAHWMYVGTSYLQL